MNFKSFATIALGASVLSSNVAFSAAEIKALHTPSTFSLNPQITDIWFEYTSDEALQAQISIKNRAEGWKTYFEENMALDAGTALIKDAPWIATNPPVGDDYVFELKLFSDATGELLDYQSADLARITSGVSPVNRLIAVDVPSVYNPFDEARLELLYESKQKVNFEVALKHPGQNWAWYGDTFKNDVKADNSHVAEPSFTPAVFPANGTGYVWEIKVFNSDTGARIDRVTRPVEIAAPGGKIKKLTADNDRLLAGETKVITVDYFALEPSDLRVDVIWANDAWGGANTIPVDAGDGMVDLTVMVPENVDAHAFARIYVKVLPRGGEWNTFYEESFVPNYVANTTTVEQYWDIPLTVDGRYSTGRYSPGASSTDVEISIARYAPLKHRYTVDVSFGDQWGEDGKALDLATGDIYDYRINHTLPENDKRQLVFSIIKPTDKAAYREAIEAMRERVDLVRVKSTRHRPDGNPELADLIGYLDGILSVL